MNFTIYPRGNGPGINETQWRSLLCIWLLFVLSSITMILRLVSQIKILRVVRADDVLMIIAWILQATKSIVTTIAVYWGLGRHSWELESPYTFANAFKYQTYCLLFGSLCGLFGRLSFAAFLLYFMRRVSPIRTYMVWVIIVVQFVVTITLLVYEMITCAPSSHRLNDMYESATCVVSRPMRTVQYIQGAVNAASNLSLTLLAFALVLSIHAPGYAKTSLMILLSFSLLAIVANILDIVEVTQTRARNGDFAYRLNVWNIWFSIENAVIIITCSIPKVRPVVLIMYQRMKDNVTWKKWSNSTGLKSIRTKLLRLTGSRHNTHTIRSSPSPPLPSIQGFVLDDDEEASILRRFRSKHSIYRKNPKSSRSCPRSHRGFLSGGSAGAFSLSSMPHSSHLCGTTGTTSIWDGKDGSSFCPVSSAISRDFVPVSSPQMTHQTIISAGDPSVPPFNTLPLPPAPAMTPPNGLSLSTLSGGGGSGSSRTSRSSRREREPQQRQNESNSSFLTLPNPTPDSGPSCAMEQQSSGLFFPILQTNNFTIEYDNHDHDHDEDNAEAWNAGMDAHTNSHSPYNHNNRSKTGEINRHGRHNIGLGWTMMRRDNHHQCNTRTNASLYNEDDADALQLQDVGSILKEPQTN